MRKGEEGGRNQRTKKDEDEEASEKRQQKKKGRMKIRRRKKERAKQTMLQSIHFSMCVSKGDQYVMISAFDFWYSLFSPFLFCAFTYTHITSCTSSISSHPFSCQVTSKLRFHLMLILPSSPPPSPMNSSVNHQSSLSLVPPRSNIDSFIYSSNTIRPTPHRLRRRRIRKGTRSRTSAATHARRSRRSLPSSSSSSPFRIKNSRRPQDKDKVRTH